MILVVDRAPQATRIPNTEHTRAMNRRTTPIGRPAIAGGFAKSGSRKPGARTMRATVRMNGRLVRTT
jgi:hypothetical protein